MRKSLPFLFLLFGASACSPAPKQERQFRPITSALNFQVESLEKKGEMRKLKDFKGKVVLLDFWATWCGPCREYVPHVEKLHAEYAAKGLEVVAVTNEERPIVEKFEKKWKHKYPVYLDYINSTNLAYGVSAYPTMVVIDRKGKIILAEIGPNPEDVRAAIEKAL